MTDDSDEDSSVEPPYTEEMLGQTRILTTRCPRPGCKRAYSIDEGNWDYQRIREALDRGDRSVLSCYHIIAWPSSSQAPNN